MRKLLILIAAMALCLVVPGVASASRRDRNHDRIPDRWERKHHLSLRVNQARRDQDHDGLRNRAEFRAGDDPRDADTDGDGVEDGAEHAGKVASFAGGVLTIELFGGDTLKGKVTDATDIECERPSASAAHDGADDNEPDGDNGGRGGVESDGDHHGDRTGRPGHGDDDENDREDRRSCTTAELTPGAVVHEAELRVTSAGTVFEQIELG